MVDPNLAQAILILTIVLAVAAVGYFVLKIIDRSLNLTAPASLVGVLTMIVVLSIIGYLGFGEERPELIALGSTALGALTATLTGMMTRPRDREPKQPELPPEPPPEDPAP